MNVIRSELRANEQAELDLWANFGDILDWLRELPEHTNNRVAADVALEIRQMLLNSVGQAEVD